MLGLCFGAPTVLIPQLRKEANATEPLTDDMASWLCNNVHVYLYLYSPLDRISIMVVNLREECDVDAGNAMLYSY